MISSKRIRVFYKRGILDKLGIVNNLVLGFSLYRLTTKYKGCCLRVRRSSDDDELDIDFVDGYIDISAIEAFCSGTDGYVSIIYNQSQVASVENAIQTTNSDQPKIVENGNFINDGLLFDGVNDYMKITAYSGIDITTPPLTIYSSVLNKTYGYVYCKNLDDFTNNQYALTRFVYLGDASKLQVEHRDKVQLTWKNKNANGLSIRYDGNLSLETHGTDLTSRPNVQIGARKTPTGYTFFLEGNFRALLIFNSDEDSNYSALVNSGI